MAGRWVRPSVGRWLSGLLVSVIAVAVVSGLVALLKPHVPVLSLLVLYILVVLPVAAVWGTALAAVASVLSTAAFAYLFLSPIHSLRVGESQNAVALGVFLITAVVVGELAARSRREALELTASRRSSRRCGGWPPWSLRPARRRWSSRPSLGRSACCVARTWPAWSATSTTGW